MSFYNFNPQIEINNLESELNKVLKEFNQILNSDNKDSQEFENCVWSPLTDIYEDNENYKLLLDLPGVTKEETKISLEEGKLEISGERKIPKIENTKYHKNERTFGKFYRSFSLPENILTDKIFAEIKAGQLIITIPKSPEAKPKEISIN